MALDEAPTSNLGDEVTDTEHEYEEDAEGEEEQEVQEKQEGLVGRLLHRPIRH